MVEEIVRRQIDTHSGRGMQNILLLLRGYEPTIGPAGNGCTP